MNYVVFDSTEPDVEMRLRLKKSHCEEGNCPADSEWQTEIIPTSFVQANQTTPLKMNEHDIECTIVHFTCDYWIWKA